MSLKSKRSLPYIFPEIMSHSEFSHATFFPSNFFQSSNICQRLTSPAVEVKRESSSLLLGFPKKRKRRKKKKDLVVLGVLGPFRSRTLHPPSCPAPPFRSAYTLVKVSVRRGACEDATAVRKSARAPSRVLSTS